MSEQKFITFGAPDIQKDEIDEVIHTLRSGWLGTGPKVAQFEKDFSSFKSVSKHNVAALNSCTAALHVSMIAANLNPGDEVITTPMTFCATINSIIHAGLTPVLADIEPDTYNIDPEQIEKKITSKTKAILPVHFAGRPCNMDRIMALAKEYNLIVIEDCAHAIETEYHGKKAGTFGDFGCFSFYITKNVVTGEGGMVLAKRTEDIDRVKRLALHGMSKDAWHRYGDSGFKHYQVVECGFKYNMMDLQAAIGIHQLARVEKNWLRRKEIWDIYQDAFGDLPVTCPLNPDPKTRHAYHLYNFMINNKRSKTERDTFLDKMTANNIGVGVHYLSIAEHPFYQNKYRWDTNNYPNARNTGRQTVSLPLSSKVTNQQLDTIINVIQKTLQN